MMDSSSSIYLFDMCAVLSIHVLFMFEMMIYMVCASSWYLYISSVDNLAITLLTPVYISVPTSVHGGIISFAFSMNMINPLYVKLPYLLYLVYMCVI